jgi:hypothetical protein
MVGLKVVSKGIASIILEKHAKLNPKTPPVNHI